MLSGYWTEGVGVMLMSEGGIKMVLVATDEQVYSTLQGPLDELFGADTFTLDAVTMRDSYPRPRDLLKLAIFLEATDKLDAIAASWLEFDRLQTSDGAVLKGSDLVKAAVDELLAPLPDNPAISGLEIALQIDTGNIIYEEFSDVEDVM